LPWYPYSLGWYLRAGKSELKTRGNAFAKFRQFLMAQYDQGNLNRQEAVSMIPPLLLDVKPQHVVLDMCAAPGSKTAQLLEGLHGGLDYEDAFKTPEGMVVANDADTRRAYLLVHQLKRYGSSAFLVTTHDGQQFPNLYRKVPVPADAGASASAAAAAAGPDSSSSSSLSATTAAAFSDPDSTLYGSELVPFDRILCDVPCSGDGTLRKNINLWSVWDTKFANGLHALQIQIACRALEMLKVGGLMVYSTCSFNPVENESVVLELCRRCKGNLEIVDVSDKLPGLLRRPGLSDWRVKDVAADRWASADDKEIVDGTHKSLRTSMFPPTAEEIAAFHPERCMRVVPHAQDTGGFFIALLRKTGETHGVKNPAAYAKLMAAQAAAAAAGEAGPMASPDPVLNDAEDAAVARAAQSVLAELPEDAGDAEGAATNAAAKEALAALPAGLDDLAGTKAHKQAVKGKDLHPSKKGSTEDPFEPLDPAVVAKIIDFYGLSHGVDHTNFFTRSDGQRKCYFVAPGIAALLHCPRNAQRLKIVHTGSRCYERGGKAEDETYPCQYRVVQEGVESVLPFMTRQLLTASFEDALQVLYRFAWPFKEFDRTGAQAALWKELTKHKNGCMVWVIPGSEIAKHTTQPKIESASESDSGAAGGAAASCRSIPICIWKTPHSVSLMISAVEQAALLRLLDPAEKFMPEEVRAKKQKKAEEEAAKLADRQAKQNAYAQKAREALEASAAGAAAPNVSVAAPVAGEAAAAGGAAPMETSTTPAPAAAAAVASPAAGKEEEGSAVKAMET
jgi:16S rRNA C967 or C1407 C5-methylase (RsmB/RsmF family)